MGWFFTTPRGCGRCLLCYCFAPPPFTRRRFLTPWSEYRSRTAGSRCVCGRTEVQGYRCSCRWIEAIVSYIRELGKGLGGSGQGEDGTGGGVAAPWTSVFLFVFCKRAVSQAGARTFFVSCGGVTGVTPNIIGVFHSKSKTLFVVVRFFFVFFYHSSLLTDALHT